MLSIETNDISPLLVSVLENENIGIWEWLPLTGTVYWSARTEAIFGIESGDFSGFLEDVIARIHPDDQKAWQTDIDACLAGKKTYDLVFRIVSKEGATIWVHAIGETEFDESGKLVKLAGIVRDVSEKKRNESIVENFFNQTMNIHLVTTMDGTILRVNKGWGTILGYQEEELQNTHFLRLVHPDDRDATTNEMSSLTQGKTTFYFENRYQHKNGNYRQLAWSATASLDDQLVFAVASDITDRRQAEQQLEAQRNLATAIAETIPASVYLFDMDINTNVYINSGIQRLLGYTAREVQEFGKKLLPALVHPNDLSKVIAFQKRILNASDNEVLSLEYRMQHTDGNWRVLRCDERVFKRRDDGSVKQKIGIALDITEQVESQRQLDYMAHYDALTGLPNRLLLNERLQQSIKRAKRSKKPLILVYIDLDRLSNVNDSLGHQHGDILLKQVSERLREVVRQEDTLARIDSDEFILLFEGIDSLSYSSVIAEKLLEVFNKSFSVLGNDIRMTCSAGISQFPDDGESPEELLRNADSAMYRAKDLGRNNFTFYSPEMTSAALEHVMMENAIRNALKNKEFFLVYQPQYRLKDGALFGMEVLLRWQHPDLGLIPPNRFIPIAEESGQIRKIGDWVLSQACHQAKDWIDRGYRFKRIAINISGLQIQQEDFTQNLEQILERSGLPPDRLELELTETFLMTTADYAVKTLRELKDKGISISMDDFGTGYASMSYLKNLPVTNLKIDQSFIKGMGKDKGDSEITRAIISIAHAFNLKTIAEGIETRHQLEALKELDCEYGQGFSLSKPLPVNEMTKLLADNESNKDDN